MMIHGKVTVCLLSAFAIGCSVDRSPAVRGDRSSAAHAAASAAVPVITSRAYASSVESPPAGWTGQVFQLSHAYPLQPPAAPVGGYPWKAIDFTSAPEAYIKSLLAYARARLEPVDWQPSKLADPDWFHAPWMAEGPASGSGREFIHGMTKERTSRPGELAPKDKQTSSFSNYAVGLYNNVGGYTFGRVWGNPAVPDTSQCSFAEGAMTIKLLFTAATVDQVPYLVGSKEWQANVFDAALNRRIPQTLRLLQVDVAVRDTSKAQTGWVFGTFFYDGRIGASNPLDNLSPVGLMWGNDPGVLPGGTLVQQWINPGARIVPHLGWGGRLNGPVDNPLSSCLSCHSTAQTPAVPMTPPLAATPQERLNWFRNIGAGQPFTTGARSLDYSLQMAVAVQNAASAAPGPGAAAMRAVAPEPRVSRGD